MKYQDNYNVSMSDEYLFSEILKEKKIRGYYNLIDQDTSIFKEFSQKVKQNNIIILGIGGSTLGTYAIYKFLQHSKPFTKQLHFLETTDPIDIKSKIRNIDLNDSLFMIISKSGATIETISLFKYIHSLIKLDETNTVIITEHDSKLNSYAHKHNIPHFEIPKNVGGRFSVFSSVGLLPLALIGVDIDAILHACKEVHDDFFQKKSSCTRILKKARFFVEHRQKFNINVLFSYSSKLEGFNKWYIQLWGESLGKIDIHNIKQGLTPVGIIGPNDQHSFLQLIIEGRRDKTITILKVSDFDNDMTIPNHPLEELEELDYLDNIQFSTLINMQADATIESLKNIKDIPYDVITIECIDEKSIAKLMYEFELLTSIVAKLMSINAYDQPGVEAGKIILKKNLKALLN